MRALISLCISLLLVACASTSTIHTKPRGAEVFINGQRCGVSPCIYHDRYGFPDRMRVQIRSPGYDSAEFFVDSEAPPASFLLWGFGSYIFHSFSKEYRFTLEPLDAARLEEMSRRRPGESVKLKDTELTSVLEQCLYWRGKKAADVWTQRFFENAEAVDCKFAEIAIASLHTQKVEANPALARVLIRYIEYRRSMNLPNVELPWSITILCSVAKVEYARRVGAAKVLPAMPAFDSFCPDESRQLRSE